MFFKKKKIRQLMKIFESNKLPQDLKEVVHAIEDRGPDGARPAFRKKLREQLMHQHKMVAMQSEDSVEAEKAVHKKATGKTKGGKSHSRRGSPKKDWFPRLGFPMKGWSYAMAVFLILVVSGFVSYPFVPPPQVEGYSVKENVREIAYNAPIKVVFNQPMDRSSVEKSFHIEPRVPGEIEWSGNTLLFVPEEPFDVGAKYAVFVEKEAKSLLQKSMAYDYEETFEIGGPPQVILFNPADESENIAINSKITVMFDRPMTALKSLDEGEESMPEINIEPATKGRYKWLGTSSIQFIPDKLQYATEYTVSIPKGTPSAQGGMTDQEFSYSFVTLKPVLMGSDPYDTYKYNGPDSTVQLDFNQPMDLTRASKNIHWYKYIGSNEKITNLNYNGPGVLDGFVDADWSEVPFSGRYLSKSDIEKDEDGDDFIDEIDDVDEEKLKKSIVLTPNGKLEYGAVYFVKVDKDFGGMEGEFTLEEDHGLLFATVGELTIVSTDPANGADLEKDSGSSRSYKGRLNWAEINFSHPLSEDEEMEKFISISPENVDKDTNEALKPSISLGYRGTEVSIRYGFKPSTEYTINVKAGIDDRFGQELQGDYSFTFKTGPLSPGFDLASGSDISILDINKDPVYYLKSTNIDEVDINFKRLSQEEFNTVYSQGYLAYRALQNIEGPFTSWNAKIDEVFNEEVVTKIDFSKVIGQQLEPGIYYFNVSSDEVFNYNNEKKVERQVFVLTSSSLAIKRSKNKLLVWATSLNDGSPVSGMEISVLNKSGNEILNGKTDSDGLVSFKTPKKVSEDDYDYYPDDYTIVGTRNGSVTLAHSTWSDGIAPWNFNIDHSMLQAEYYVYSYTDRPIYRPGHTVHFKGLVRKDVDAKFELPRGTDVHVIINDSQGETLVDKDVTLNDNGTFDGELTLSANARTGNYRITTSLPGASGPAYMNKFFTSFQVAEYRKPDYELTIETDKDDYVNGDTAKLNVKGAYFFGAPMPDANIEWTVKSQDYYFFLSSGSDSPFASKWYSFSNDGYWCYWGCEGKNEVVSSGKAKLNEDGEYTIELPLDISEKDVSQFYTVEVTAFDLNNQSVSNRVTVPVHKGEYYMGILNEDYVVSQGDAVSFDVISVDFEGMPIAGKKAEVSFNKRKWNTVKKKNLDGGFYYENSYEDEVIDKKSVTTDSKGYAKVEFTAREGGSFRAVVTSKNGKGNDVTASTSVYVSTSDFVNWGMENNDRMELIADKLEYKPGETAHILVKSPYQNVWALVTQERGEIISEEIIKIASNSETIDIPITEDSIPNVFVSVVLVKGSGNEAGLIEPPLGANDERGVASFKVGYATLQVDNSSKLLSVDVESEWSKYRPGDEVRIDVKTKDSSGKPVSAEVSVSVVDKSVLSLTETVTADLLNAFYRKRLLGVNTAHTLTKAISRVNVQIEAGLKGGGGAAPAKRGVFKDTAYWEATLETDSNGEGSVTFKLPDNLTTWEILAIGITDDTLVGSQKSEFLVTKDVLVRPVLPRFMIVNDTMKVGGIVHNYMDREMIFKVDLDVEGVEFTGGDSGNASEKFITLKPGKELKVEWDIKVLNKQEAKFTFDVRAKDNEAIGDILEQKLPIHPFSFPEIVATSLTIDDAKKYVETVWLPIGVDQNFGELMVSVSPTLTGSISSGLEYLMKFPYGCTEQTASALLPNLVLKQMLDLPTIDDDLVDTEELQKNVESGLQDLYRYQQSGGGWGLWENSDTSAYLTSYVLYTLNEAQKAGYTVDPDVVARGKKYLNNYINTHALGGSYATESEGAKRITRNRANERAYMLFVLAETGDGDLALTNNLYEFRDHLNIFSKAYLVMAFDKILDSGLEGDAANGVTAKIETIKNDIISKAKETPRGVRFEEIENLYYMFDTNTRTTALVLQMLSRVEPGHPYVPKILRHMLIEKKDGHYVSTQETAVSLIAMIEYLVSSGELEASYNGIVKINGEEMINKSFTENNLTETEVLNIALTGLRPNNADNELTFERNGSGKMYVDMNLKYFVPAEQIEARDEGILVMHEYFNIGDERMENPVESVKLGENLRARITLVVPEDSYYVMVEDFLPAGLEGIDFSLKTSQKSLEDSLYEDRDYFSWWYYDSSWYFNHSEVRDDRVMYFADNLPAGVYELNYFVRATTPGEFRDKPVLAQELYFPEVFGRSAGNIFTVSP